MAVAVAFLLATQIKCVERSCEGEIVRCDFRILNSIRAKELSRNRQILGLVTGLMRSARVMALVDAFVHKLYFVETNQRCYASIWPHDPKSLSHIRPITIDCVVARFCVIYYWIKVVYFPIINK